MLNTILIPIAVSIVGYTYAAILTAPGNVLYWWYSALRWIAHRFSGCSNKRLKICDYILKAIVTCEKCVSGQIMLWYGLYIGVSIDVHIFMISFSIFVTSIITKILDRL